MIYIWLALSVLAPAGTVAIEPENEVQYPLKNIVYIMCREHYREIDTGKDYTELCRRGSTRRARYRFGPYLLSEIENDPGLILINPSREVDEIKYLEKP